jgi:hypothetical protein
VVLLDLQDTGRAKKPGKDRRSSGGERPNSYQRRARKYFLLVKHGDGESCPCYFCGETLTFTTLTLDRKKPGIRGGTYAKENLLPACMKCNCARGDLSVRKFKEIIAQRRG